MSRKYRPGGPYVPPIKATDGLPLVDQVGRGKYTLVAGATYFNYLVGGADTVEGFGLLKLGVGWEKH